MPPTASPCFTGPTGTTVDPDSVSHELVSRLADQDLAGLRCLLEALGDVDLPHP